MIRRLLVALGLVGVGIASYLSWVKLTNTEAYCGGVGDCSSVQNSPYAYLLGIPVAYLGLLCYLVLLGLAIYNLRTHPAPGGLADLAFFALAVGGFAFSAYLTYTELFLIHAICPWCVASFVNLTIIALLSAFLVFGRGSEPEAA